ncbi:MAG: competence/damage-inducible protein A [Candidatus Cloacimonadota bacterium]|nr:competence/damage-inducible protein A [Candidatus Cloacimonadota bacterium]
MLKISLITIGNEILLGKTVNTNLAYIGNELAKIGLPLHQSVTIKDESVVILKTLEEIKKESDMVITTGGLGPTKDDVTKKSIAKFFSKDLEFREAIWSHIKELYHQKNIQIPEIVKTQAEVPIGFKTIKNKYGTAPGLHFQNNRKNFFALPGVPSEMKEMVKDYLIPFLRKNYQTKSFYLKTIRTIGLLEADLSGRLKDVKETKSVNIAFLPQPGRVSIRVYGTELNEFNTIVNMIEKRIGEFVYGYNEDNIVELCHKKLLSQNKTLAVAESCTGGLIQNLFTNNSGSSKYLLGGIVSYSSKAKMDLLNVRKETLERFGAVSEQTVKKMLQGVRRRFKSNYAIAVSGIAGPTGGTPEKPVGLVFIGVNIEGNILIKKFNFSGTREQIKEKSAINSIYLLLKNI